MAGSLALPRRGFVEVELADGSSTALNVYEARVLWHGRSRLVPVYETGEAGDPLAGMSLLRGSRLEVEIVPGGEVRRKLEAASFTKTSQKGSHVKFVRHTDEGIRTAIVPRHILR